MARGTVVTGFAATPSTVFLEISRPCNLRCVHCDIYKQQNVPGELTLSERARIIQEVASWSTSTRIVFTGGELFLDKRRLYTSAQAAKDYGVPVTVNTNGTLLLADDLRRLPTSGIKCIVISLDSDLAEVHDRLRGVPGTFRRATSALRELANAPEACGFSVLTSTILGRHNIDRVPEMVDCFESLGAEALLFQPIQPNFAAEYHVDWWRGSGLFPVDKESVERGIDALVAAKESGRRLYQSTPQFEDMRRYLVNPLCVPAGQCQSAERNLMVDTTGQVSLCFHMERLGIAPIGNVRATSLRGIWDSVMAREARGRMSACALGCGTMICHAR